MKRSPVWLTAALLVSSVYLAEAQQPKKVFRIGYLSSGNPTTESARAEGLRLALRDLGYIEGQNIAIEYRFAEGRPDRESGLAAELVRLKVDIIVVASGDVTIRAAKNATKTIPIVMGQGSDPVRAGLVESLARPGGNVTGITRLTRDLGGKRLECSKKRYPNLAVSRFSTIRPFRPVYTRGEELLPADARALKLTIELWEIRAVDDFEKVFAALNKQRPDGLYPLGAGGVMRPNRKRIVGFALKSRLPAVYNDRTAIDAGGLMYYGEDVRRHLPARRDLRRQDTERRKASRPPG
jgi:putative ABC transport system substrate-binding protein